MARLFKRKKSTDKIWTKRISDAELMELDVNLKFSPTALTMKDMLFFDSMMVGSGEDETEGAGMEISHFTGMVDIISRFIYAEFDGIEYKLSPENAKNYVQSLTQEEFAEVSQLLLEKSMELEDEKNQKIASTKA